MLGRPVPRYVAPETQKVRLAGAEHPTGGYTKAVDMWAAGVMLYLLFTAQAARRQRGGPRWTPGGAVLGKEVKFSLCKLGNLGTD